MRHGYYIARTGERFGDPECARFAVFLWRAWHRRSGTPYDGMSVVVRDDGAVDVLGTHNRMTATARGAA